MKVRIGTVAFFLACAPAISPALGTAATPAAAANCPHSGGYIDGPFVPTAATARRIYLAVLDAVAPDLRSQRHLRVVVEDEGDHWSVYSSAPVETESGHLVMLQGGGLGLEINKCSGAISNVAWQR